MSHAPKWKVNQSGPLQLCGIIKQPAVHVGLCAFGVSACQTNRFTAGGSNSFNVQWLSERQSFCYDFICEMLFFPPYHHSAPYAVCSESITWLCVMAAAAVYSYSGDHQAFPLLARRSQKQAWGKLRFPSIYLSNSLFSLGKIALTHHIIRKITGTTNRDTGSAMHDKVAEILLKKSCASPF